jgi:hypothetical protein
MVDIHFVNSCTYAPYLWILFMLSTFLQLSSKLLLVFKLKWIRLAFLCSLRFDSDSADDPSVGIFLTVLSLRLKFRDLDNFDF